MILMLAMALVLFHIGFPDHSALPPEAVAGLRGQDTSDLQCYDEPGAAATTLELPRLNRAANFRIRGEERCYRRIFTYDERDPFVEIAQREQMAKAKQVALALSHRFAADIHAGRMPSIGVLVNEEAIQDGADANDEDLHRLIESIYREELAGVLGSQAVRHLRPRGDEAPVVHIRLRRVQNGSGTNWGADVGLAYAGPKGEILWQEL